MTNPINLTNQELIQEFQKRIQNKTLGAEIVANEVEEQTSSLLSRLDGKHLLFVIGLTVGFTLLVWYSVKATSSQITKVKVEFQDSPNHQIELDLKN